jgi:hypothetical protein
MLFACRSVPVIIVLDKLSVIHPPPDKTQLNEQSAQFNRGEVPLRPGKIFGRYGFAFCRYKQTAN